MTDPRLTAWEIGASPRAGAWKPDGESGGRRACWQSSVRKAEIARELAYRLYTICERKKRATEALSYNGLVQSWPEIMRLARDGAASCSRAIRTVPVRINYGRHQSRTCRKGAGGPQDGPRAVCRSRVQERVQGQGGCERKSVRRAKTASIPNGRLPSGMWRLF